jgi:TatD DNase family protein
LDYILRCKRKLCGRVRNHPKELETNKVHAIGEIGLDLYWDKSTLEIQKDAFRTQVKWAKELNLPIDIHCREAFTELFELLEELHDDKLFGVLHCFTGSLSRPARLSI